MDNIIEQIYYFLLYFNINIKNLIENNKKLTNLQVIQKNIDVEFSKYIIKRINSGLLKTLHISIDGLNNIRRDIRFNIFEAIRYNKSIEHLFICMSLSSHEVICLSEIINYGNIKYLFLPNCNIGHNINILYGSFKKTMYSSLKDNNTLISLNLSNNFKDYICNNPICLIADYLKNNKSLKSLNISNNILKKDGCKSLAEALKINTTLNTLNLSFCDFGNGFTYLLDVFKYNNNLISLFLQSNITKENASEIIKNNKILKNLYLGFNDFYNDGAICIAKALLFNRTLKRLDLIDNKIQSDGVIELIKNSKYLKYLCLSMNDINYTIIQEICPIIHLTNLREINLNNSYIDNIKVYYLTKILELNNKIKKEKKLSKFYLKLYLIKGNILFKDIQEEFLKLFDEIQYLFL